MFKSEYSRAIDFKALGLKGSAKLLLNPSDEGFSKEFYLYGFREPLNTYAIYETVRKEKSTVLDIGSNLGYFSLVELQAGAKHVISVEPVPSTFNLLSKTLKDIKNVTLLNMAISDKHETLKLYIPNEINVTSSSKSLLLNSGRKVAEEILAKAIPISTIAQQYPVSTVRMDVEGHEYRILKDNIPEQIETICIELHVIPPYTKTHATKLLQHLNSQGFQASYAVREMGHGFYPLVKHLGLKMAYRLLRSLKGKALKGPDIQRNLDLIKLADEIGEIDLLHLILQR